MQHGNFNHPKSTNLNKSEVLASTDAQNFETLDLDYCVVIIFKNLNILHTSLLYKMYGNMQHNLVIFQNKDRRTNKYTNSGFH